MADGRLGGKAQASSQRPNVLQPAMGIGVGLSGMPRFSAETAFFVDVFKQGDDDASTHQEPCRG